jgi:hypothetical protein
VRAHIVARQGSGLRHPPGDDAHQTSLTIQQRHKILALTESLKPG